MSISSTSSTSEGGPCLYFDIGKGKCPIVYHEMYNVSFGGLEKCHIFDAKKWKNVMKHLKEKNFIRDDMVVEPREAKNDDLRLVHTETYLKKLKKSCAVAKIAEVPLIALVPNFLVQKSYLRPMRFQTGGSVIAGKLAIERGWAINIGGGFHHCSGNRGAGFCPYADITLLIRTLQEHRLVKTAFILDLDAHQGNGYQRDFMGVNSVYIMDVYNSHIYPNDVEAKQAIRKKVELRSFVEDLEYMMKVRKNLKAALNEFPSDIVVYNAGTDILDTDPLGRLAISERGVILRDQFVFEFCRKKQIPIVMLTSGGYIRKSARVIADSIINLQKKGLISCQLK